MTLLATSVMIRAADGSGFAPVDELAIGLSWGVTVPTKGEFTFTLKSHCEWMATLFGASSPSAVEVQEVMRQFIRAKALDVLSSDEDVSDKTITLPHPEETIMEFIYCSENFPELGATQESLRLNIIDQLYSSTASRARLIEIADELSIKSCSFKFRDTDKNMGNVILKVIRDLKKGESERDEWQAKYFENLTKFNLMTLENVREKQEFTKSLSQIQEELRARSAQAAATIEEKLTRVIGMIETKNAENAALKERLAEAKRENAKLKAILNSSGAGAITQ